MAHQQQQQQTFAWASASVVPTAVPPGTQFQLVTFQAAPPALPPPPPPHPTDPAAPPQTPPPAVPPKQENPKFDPRVVYAAVTTSVPVQLSPTTAPQVPPPAPPVPPGLPVPSIAPPVPTLPTPPKEVPKFDSGVLYAAVSTTAPVQFSQLAAAPASAPAPTQTQTPAPAPAPAPPSSKAQPMAALEAQGVYYYYPATQPVYAAAPVHAAAPYMGAPICAAACCPPVTIIPAASAPPPPLPPPPPPPNPPSNLPSNPPPNPPPTPLCTGHHCGCFHHSPSHFYSPCTQPNRRMTHHSYYDAFDDAASTASASAPSITMRTHTHNFHTRFHITKHAPHYTCLGCSTHQTPHSLRARCKVCAIPLCEDCVRISYDSNGDIRLLKRWWREFRALNGVDAVLASDIQQPELRGHRHTDWMEVKAGAGNDPGRKSCVGCAKELGNGNGDRWRCKGKNGAGNTGDCDLVICGVCRWIVVGNECNGRMGELRFWNARRGRV